MPMLLFLPTTLVDWQSDRSAVGLSMQKNFQMKITYLFVSFIWVCQISGQSIFRMGTETHGRTACDKKNQPSGL